MQKVITKCEGCTFYFRDRKGEMVCHLYVFGLKCKDGDQYNGKK